MGCVYVARNRINNKRYVGKTLSTLSLRIQRHFATARRGRGGMAFAKALVKYGEAAFEWTAVFESDDNLQLCDVEKQMVAALQTKGPLGYNLTDGGDGSSGFNMPESTRDKIRVAATGRKRSLESRARQSAATKGRTLLAETKARMSAAKRGSKHSDATKAKLSEIAKRRTYSPETRAKMSAARRGYKHSQETKAKIAESQTGKTRPSFSLEWRRNLSLAQLRRHANKKQKVFGFITG